MLALRPIVGATLAALALAPAAVGQSVRSAPPALAFSWGSGCVDGAYGQQRQRHQQLVEIGALPGDLVPASKITALGWRRCLDDAVTPRIRLDLEASLYDTTLVQALMTQTFATNRSGARGGVVIRRRTVDLPALGLTGPDRAGVLIPLDVPHAYGGPNLLLEVVTRGASSGPTGWKVDACLGALAGDARVFGFGCKGSRATVRSTGGSADYTIGSTIHLDHAGGPSTAPAVAVLGFRPDRLASVPLPLELGLVGAPGCRLYTSLDVQSPLRLDGGGQASVPYTMPLNPFFSGITFYLQWIVVAPGANPLGVQTSPGVKITLGPIRCDMATLTRTKDSADSVGDAPPVRNGGPVLLLRY